jgi:hypothetical protein
MWMQVLAASGLPIIGERFPLDWETALPGVNPHGFYESTLRDGVHWATNPDPRSGEYLHPHDTRLHAVKIFPEGLLRSDLAFLDRVLVTIRPWHEYVASIERLFRIENEARGWEEADRPPRVHPALEWWVAYFSLVRDVAMRRHRVHIQPYAQVLACPEEVVPRVLGWITEDTEVAGMLDIDAAIACVKPARAAEVEVPCEGVDDAAREVFDALYAAVLAGEGLDAGLLARMNALQERLAPTLAAHAEATVRWLSERPLNAAPVEPLALHPQSSQRA